jgi:hypothetical protein
MNTSLTDGQPRYKILNQLKIPLLTTKPNAFGSLLLSKVIVICVLPFVKHKQPNSLFMAWMLTHPLQLGLASTTCFSAQLRCLIKKSLTYLKPNVVTIRRLQQDHPDLLNEEAEIQTYALVVAIKVVIPIQATGLTLNVNLSSTQDPTWL